MAELNVQPKRGNPWWLWLLLAIVAIGIIYFLSRGCNNSVEKVADTVADSASSKVNAATDNWDKINFDAPATAYDEITDANISVRGNDQYSIYGLGENILFDTDKSEVLGTADQNLKQISASLNKRYNGGQVRIYGYTDAEGSAGYNKQLAEQRAEAVKNWLIKSGDVTEDRISVHPVGEAKPIASNNTEAGRQQNRRVEIVAMGGQKQ